MSSARFPDSLRYTKEHEWARADGSRVVVGITDHAQSSLGDIVFVELPKVGRELKAGETFGVVESIKAVSDLYAPLSGKVVRVNESLPNQPGLLNQEPQGAAWLIEIEPSAPQELQSLLTSSQYAELVASLG